jgi:hypothetical protein
MQGNWECNDQAVEERQHRMVLHLGEWMVTTSYRTSEQIFLERLTQRKVDVRYGPWNVRRFIEEGAKELAMKNLDSVGVKQVRWDRSGNEPADDYTFVYGDENANHHLKTRLFVNK